MSVEIAFYNALDLKNVSFYFLILFYYFTIFHPYILFLFTNIDLLWYDLLLSVTLDTLELHTNAEDNLS